MGEQPCHRDYCAACDAAVTVVNERCFDCGEPLP